MDKLLTKNIKLNNGVEMPVVGLGTYKITDPDAGVAAITAAINMGYRMIDTADLYSNSAIIKKAIEKSSKTRQDLFITSKIWITDQAHDATIKAFNSICEQLGTDYLDLLLVHWPANNGTECYKALEELYKAGKVRAIGVSNYLVKDLKELIEVAEIKPMVDQVELHPLLPELDLQEFAKENDVVLTSWRTMMGGDLDSIDYLTELAKKYKVSSNAIALKWALQQDIVVIPKSIHEDRIAQNANEIDTFELSDDEIKKINELKPEKRLGENPLTYGKKGFEKK